MHPFVNMERRLIFWWSPKCGCTTVKSIMLGSMLFDYVSRDIKADEEQVTEALDLYLARKTPKVANSVYDMAHEYLSSRLIGGLHSYIAGSRLYLGIEVAFKFTNVLFVRDPFKRFVSGFVDKHVDGFFSRIYAPRSFKDAAANIDKMEPHHFAPQASEAYLPALEYDRVFDIDNIDYEYLSGLLEMRVAPRVMNKKSPFSGPCVEPLADAPYEHLVHLKSLKGFPDHECFYDEESRGMVADYYRDDLELMRRWLNSSGA